MTLSPRQRPAAHLSSIALDPGSPVSLHRQLYFAVREAILGALLPPATRLPSTRVLAEDLGVSRNTVLGAFAQLTAEGYLEGRVGAGSFVSRQLPEDSLEVRERGRRGDATGPAPGPSARGLALAGLKGEGARPRAFAPGLPELGLFPFETWARLLARHWRSPSRSLLIGGDAGGHGPLREAIAAYLGAARAVSCTPDQVFVVSGAQQALDLAARVLIDPGDAVWVEEPGYPGLRGALLASGARLAPVRVDDEGISVAAGKAAAPDARMACVSPSHQYPLGVTMSLARRLELLEWARAADAFVLEDDYDSEYRYAGRPFAALQSLDTDGRIIYVGTMSKVMFPALRLGYMVVPPHLVTAFRAVRRLLDTHPSSVIQPALADFIGEGHLSTHIRRMRKLYAMRQRRLVAAGSARLGDRLAFAPDEAGMHLVAFTRDASDDRLLSAAAAKHGIEARPLADYYANRPDRSGLVLGYAGIGEDEITAGVDRLATAFAEVA